MPASTQVQKKVTVKNHLLRCVARAGSEPELLPGERTLAVQFGVSRKTIREALKELRNNEALISLPGRRGVFTNPAHAQAVPYIIGLFFNDGHLSHISSPHMPVLTSFFNELSNITIDYELPLLNGDSPDEMISDLKNYSFDAVLWFSDGKPEMVAALDSLIAENFPIVVIQPLFLDYLSKTAKNGIGIDFESSGRIKARSMIEDGCRNIIYVGEKRISAHGYLDELSKSGLTVPDENFIESLDIVDKKLASLLKHRKCDSIYSDGYYALRYQKIADVVKSRPEWRKIRIYAGAGTVEESFRKANPECNITLLDDTQKIRCGIGRAAAGKIRRMFDGEKRTFDNIAVKP